MAAPSLSIDLYLPALPQLSESLDATPGSTALTLTAFLIGMGVGQLLVGPLSDAVGRRSPLLWATAVFALASAGCAVAPDIGTLIAMRFVQALAGSASLVTARAVIRDLVTGAALVRTLASAMLISGATPILAPAIGALLITVMDWQGLFWVLAAFGLVLFAASMALLPETRKSALARRGIAEVFRENLAVLLRSRPFVAYAGAAALAVAAMLTYTSAAPFVYEAEFGFSAQAFGALFALNSLGLMVGVQASGRVAQRRGARRTLWAGLGSGMLFSLLLVATALWHQTALTLVVLWVLILSLGVVVLNATALGLTDHPEAAGSAAAVIGSLQFGLAGVVSGVTSLLGPHESAVKMAGVMTGCVMTAVVLLGTLARRRSACGETQEDPCGRAT